MTNLAMEHRPSLAERLRSWLGFRYHHGGEPQGTEQLEGWMRTDIRLHFSFADRLRLLLTGKLFVACIVHHDTPSATVCKSRIDWRIIAPGER